MNPQHTNTEDTIPSLSELTADYGQLDSDEVLRAW